MPHQQLEKQNFDKMSHIIHCNKEVSFIKLYLTLNKWTLNNSRNVPKNYMNEWTCVNFQNKR